LYARVSTNDQQTLPLQIRTMREYAAKRGWTIVAQIKEVGSGSSQREQRSTLLGSARRREIDVVLVWRLDRWGRSVADLVSTLQELHHLGVGFVSLTEALDLTTPAGRAMAGLVSVFAEFERARQTPRPAHRPRFTTPPEPWQYTEKELANLKSPGSFRSAEPLSVRSSSRFPCSAVSQFPRRTPIQRTPFTRRIPAASSGLSKPESAASKATLRSAASRRLIVVGAYRFCSKDSVAENYGPVERKPWF
jgi:hypothetical protein